MLVTVSATTVPTVTYLSLYDLKNYKKQFQSFWTPFIEQFIPATTVWVAGERWCNEPCTIISPCDYDFEYVESESSITQLAARFASTSGTTQRGYSNTTIPTNSATANPLGRALPTNQQNSSEMSFVKDLGLTNVIPFVKNANEVSIDISSYRNRFTETKIETTTIQL